MNACILELINEEIMFDKILNENTIFEDQNKEVLINYESDFNMDVMNEFVARTIAQVESMDRKNRLKKIVESFEFFKSNKQIEN